MSGVVGAGGIATRFLTFEILQCFINVFAIISSDYCECCQCKCSHRYIIEENNEDLSLWGSNLNEMFDFL